MTPRLSMLLARVYGHRRPVQLQTSGDLNTVMGLKHGPAVESYSTYPEQRYFAESATKGVLDTVAKHGNAATDMSVFAQETAAEKKGQVGQKFNTVVPTTNTVMQVAGLGKPARGEYKKTYDTVVDLFGHDPHGVAAWVAINAGLSPNAAYPDHASAATHLTANWLALSKGQRKNEHTIRRLFSEANSFGKLHTPAIVAAASPDQFNEKGQWLGRIGKTGQSFSGPVASTVNVDRGVRLLQNIDKVKAAMERPELPESGQWLSLLSGIGPQAGMLKVPNFFSSYANQKFGAAIDTHMNRLLFHPELGAAFNTSPIMRQLDRAFAGNKPAATELKDLIRSKTPINSELVKAMMKHPSLMVPVRGTGLTIPVFLKELNGNLSSNPGYYAAYKHTLADAADKLGWNISEIQESVWTGLVALMAANGVTRDTGIPIHEVQKHLTADAVRKGWQNLEFFLFPSVVDAYKRAGTDPDAVLRVEQRARAAAKAGSRTGVVPGGLTPGLRAIAAYLPGSSNKGTDAAGPIRKALIKSLTQHGALDASGKLKLQQIGQRLKMRLMAQYDAPLPISSVLQRVTAANHKTFVEHLKKVLQQSGVIPHEVSPAIHDVGGAARASVFAAGQFRNPNSPGTASAWTGMLGRQPGMLAFRSNPSGPDSIYRFVHGDTDAIQQALSANGINGRVLVPHDKTFQVYVYDKGRTKREQMAAAMTQLGVPADEWQGAGEVIGGKKSDQKDMGRESYRGQINAAESGGAV